MNKFICALALSFIMCFAVTVYSEGVNENLKNGVVRLHIIANSDSDEDQEVKIKVRDAVLEEVRTNGFPENTAEVKKTADEVLKTNGFTYSSEIYTGIFYFPEKEYKDTVFPNGEYNAVRVVLGDGKGKNWWCVMYPPLCFDEEIDGELSGEGREELRGNLDDETYELVTQKPEIKFKLVEAVNAVLNKHNNR